MFEINQLRDKMQKALEAFKKELAGVRTGRAHASLLDGVRVESYGAQMPLSQVGTVSVPESRMLSVQVWDKSLVKNVEKAIMESDLGVNPVVDGTLIRIPLPDLSEERRKELVKLAARFAEGSRVSVRNIRREGIDDVRKLEKDGEISKDDEHRHAQEIQKITDEFIGKIDELLQHKEKEILTL